MSDESNETLCRSLEDEVMSPATKGEQLEGDSTIKTFLYKAVGEESNGTSCGGLEDKVIGHFITMVHVDGGLNELDGQKDGSVRDGDTTQETLLENARKSCGEVYEMSSQQMAVHNHGIGSQNRLAND